MTESSPLIGKMRALACTAAISEEDALELREMAKDLEDAMAAPQGDGWARRMLGCYARARLLYCQISGEPLV